MKGASGGKGERMGAGWVEGEGGVGMGLRLGNSMPPPKYIR